MQLAAWPHYAADERSAVDELLRSGLVNTWTGEAVHAFESAYARSLGRRHAIALANGTLALEAALLAFGIGAGDDVLVPPRTFVATASAVLSRGARPIFADLGVDSQMVDAESLEAARTPQTRAVIVVHLGGAMANMDEIVAWARPHGIRVIEDCAQAHGASWRGRPAGSLGDAAAFSFCQDKIISTGGEGGLLALDDTDAFRRAWSAKEHGKSWSAVHERTHPPGFRWLVDQVGSNWRLSGIQAVIGSCQLKKLDTFVARRRALASQLTASLAAAPELVPERQVLGSESAFYRAYFFLQASADVGARRDAILERLSSRGWPAHSGSCPEVYREALFVHAGLAPVAPLARAQALGPRSLAFLVHPTILDEQMASYAAAILETVREVYADGPA